MPHLTGAALAWSLAAGVAAGILSWAGTRALIPVLRRRRLLDVPNERSSHRVPTPRGGGLAVIAAVLLVWVALAAASRVEPRITLVMLAAAGLAAVSWIDDRRGLAPGLRLVAQAVAVALGAVALPAGGGVLGPLVGSTVALGLAALAWLWFVNLFNFMDGIDGLAGGEAAAIGVGLVLFATVGAGRDPGLAALAAAAAGAAIGFLMWNWAPAQVFLGDVGSVPLGYLIGFLLLGAALRGYWRAALILPAYFLADASLTLLRRLWRGERVWLAHREHLYQRAVERGLGHAAVSGRVLFADAGLVLCAWLAENGWGAAGLGAAATILALLMLTLVRRR